MSFWNMLGVILGVAPRLTTGKPGARAYAIGDVHGCLEPLETLLAAIEAEIQAGPDLPTFVIFLGDLIDRGPDSAGVVERLRRFKPVGAHPIFIMGNHEEFMLRALAGEPDAMHNWLEYGGRECVASYGLTPSHLTRLDDQAAAALLQQFVPPSHRLFIESFADTFRFGDYVFVHAGLRPGVPLEQQQSSDLRWIREPFLSDRGDHGFTVVHGHTIVDAVQVRSNRIAIDTGPYRGGPLTALVMEGSSRRLIQARGLTITTSTL